MPVYEYRCRTCDHQFEIQQSITDDNLTECPECGGDLRKVFAPVGIAFKGSGFYKNDARTGTSTSSTSSTSPSTAGSSSGGDSSSNSSSTGSSSEGSSATAAPAAATTGSD